MKLGMDERFVFTLFQMHKNPTFPISWKAAPSPSEILWSNEPLAFQLLSPREEDSGGWQRVDARCDFLLTPWAHLRS